MQASKYYFFWLQSYKFWSVFGHDSKNFSLKLEAQSFFLRTAEGWISRCGERRKAQKARKKIMPLFHSSREK